MSDPAFLKASIGVLVVAAATSALNVQVAAGLGPVEIARPVLTPPERLVLELGAVQGNARISGAEGDLRLARSGERTGLPVAIELERPAEAVTLTAPGLELTLTSRAVGFLDSRDGHLEVVLSRGRAVVTKAKAPVTVRGPGLAVAGRGFSVWLRDGEAVVGAVEATGVTARGKSENHPGGRELVIRGGAVMTRAPARELTVTSIVREGDRFAFAGTASPGLELLVRGERSYDEVTPGPDGAFVARLARDELAAGDFFALDAEGKRVEPTLKIVLGAPQPAAVPAAPRPARSALIDDESVLVDDEAPAATVPEGGFKYEMPARGERPRPAVKKPSTPDSRAAEDQVELEWD